MTLKKILEGRWFGHPLHPLIVHLPLGLWLLGTVLDVVAFSSPSERWALEGAAWSLAIGTAVAVIAVVLGLNDWLDIRADHPAQRAAMWHMGLTLPATLLFIIDSIMHLAARQNGHVSHIMLGLSIVGYLLTLVGGYLGGLLVYDNGISVGRHRRTTGLPHNTIHEPRKGTSETHLAPSQGISAEFHPIIPEAALPEGLTLRAEIGGTLFMLVKAEGKVYAVQDFCTHRCAPLSEGAVCGNEIRCAWHNSQFDLTSGKVTHGPAKVDLNTYDVRIRGGIIHVCIDRPAQTAAASQQQDQAVQSSDRTPERRNPEESPTYTREGQSDIPARRAPAE